MIAIVCYGLGNVQAIANIYKRLNVPVTMAVNADQLDEADRIILPGVGAFDWAMTRLNASGMRESLDRHVLEKGKPVLGICVGMQMLAGRSEEGELPGLGWIPGEVRRFKASTSAGDIRLPHMGWNDIRAQSSSGLFDGFDSTARFYFLHSYYFSPANQSDVLVTTDYHGQFASGVGSRNIFGVQFHPEKSQTAGFEVLRAFLRV
jgi:imidazole glycerol-phosphate synthase subunit HisH